MNRSISVFLSTVLMLVAAPVWAEPAMVWSQDDGSAINVYYSPDGIRAIPITTVGVHISPNLFRAQDETWLTWVDKSEPEIGKLMFARLSEQGSIVETGSVATKSSHIYAPAISVDPSGFRVWLVWAEYNGRRENLYASYRNSKDKRNSKRISGWQKPLQVTPDSQYSASIPIIDTTLVDRILISWVRSSPVSSEIASVEIMANDWNHQQAALNDGSVSSVREVEAPQRVLSLRKAGNYDAFAKKLKDGQPRSQDERQWETLTGSEKTLMGAVHSGSGPSKRLAKEVKMK